MNMTTEAMPGEPCRPAPVWEKVENGSKVVAFAAVAAGLTLFGTPPVALVSGILFALLFGHLFGGWNHKVSKWLLQTCVVLLGFGVDLPVVLRVGLSGAMFAAVTIASTLLLGWWLGGKLALDRKTSALIAAGTAICGGSAIAAVSSVIAATETEIAMSIGTVFLLNAVALYLFPVVGHLLHLSQAQFGVWAGVAIHDISSVVGAGLSYGPEALATATAVKLSRTLWIVPVTLAIAFRFRRAKADAGGPAAMAATHRVKITIPWFAGLFLLASLCRSYFPGIAAWSGVASAIARHGMILALFLIGASLSVRALRALGWRAVTAGLVLWIFVSSASLLAVRFI